MSLYEAITIPSLRQKLEEGGFQTTEQVLAIPIKDLAAGKDLSINTSRLY
jgi:hypothetical protein